MRYFMGWATLTHEVVRKYVGYRRPLVERYEWAYFEIRSVFFSAYYLFAHHFVQFF
jgi:hypothetical protein